MKRALALTLSVIMMLGACTILHTTSAAEDGMVDSGINYNESTETLKNPHMGYPSHAAISMNDSFTARNDSGFMWYYVNISAYSGSNSMLPENVTWPADRVDRPISDSALEAFRGTLENLRQNGGSCFIRFVYDWDGQTGREPSDIETILTHIEQLCGVVSDFADICLGFECGIIGVFGEMHSSIYCGSQYANRIIDAYLDNTPDTMILMVRTPAYITQYLGLSRSELSELVTEKGSPEYRLSYFNDGYMNSDNDLGTWANREQDIKFLSSQSEHATYGGEYGSAYWILPCNSCLPENAIPEMYKTHVNFIRGNVYSTWQNDYFGYDSYTYGEEYEEDWYPDNSAFYGVNCHQFIVSHLGYRLVVRESKLSADPVAGGSLKLTGKIENTGFANVLHEPTTQILLVQGSYTYVCDVAIDAGDFKSCTVTDYATTLNLPSSMPTGEYEVYMRMTASTGTDFLSVQSAIQFANEGEIYNPTYGANLIGTVDIGEGSAEDASAANDVFCEIGSNAVSGGRVTEGAPIINGYGMPISGTLQMNYHKGDTLTLSAWNMTRSDADVTYKWYKGTTVVGTEETLTVENLKASDAGAYKLTVTVGGKGTTTMSVNVTVDEHTFGDYVSVKKTSCHTAGSERRTCSHCSLSEMRVVPTTAHKEGVPKTVLSSCTVRGSITVSCTKCSDVLDYEILDLEPHDCETIIEEPTCLRDGKKTLDCVVCDYESSESIEALGHNYVYTINGNEGSGICSRCKESTETKVFDGYNGTGVSAEDFDGELSGAVSVDATPITLIGEGGYLTEYQAGGDGYVTILFRIEGAQEPVKLGKFRTTAYASDDKNNLGDSNNADNYYGDLLFTVDGDGVWALTLRKYLMLPYGNGGWGRITHAAFNDPDSTKGKDTVNPNADATMELVGVYDGKISYHALFIDAEGNFLEGHEGAYNPSVTWSNKICKTVSADELYQGEVPVKRATEETIYTFSHWEDAEGNRADVVMGNVILHPVFTERENTCLHTDVDEDIITPPTCTEKGEGADVCADCGLPMGEPYEIEATGHRNEEKTVKSVATFKKGGEYDVYCADCLAFLRTESIPKVKNPFKDVDVNGWYSDAVAYAYTNSIFGGTSATTFAPNANMTRAMFVTVLGRMSGVPEDKNAATAFTDVKRGQYYTGYVAWANKNGIVNGRTAKTFAPDELITREEMCVMLVRYCEYELISLGNAPVVDSFADSTKFAKWSINQIETCRRAGLVGGKAVNSAGGALFVPKGNATRAEVATIIYNLKTKYVD